ncbi:MAG: PAS domain S-box protein [Acetobacteraceae bacterium]|jgi:PAS domain S-box-containing protein
MSQSRQDEAGTASRGRLSEEQLRLAEASTGIGAFEFDLSANRWVTTPQVAVLFGCDPAMTTEEFASWEQAIFVDDRLKLRAAMETAGDTGSCNVEVRVRHPDGGVHWLTIKGQTVRDSNDRVRWLRGACYDITERKTLEVRLLALAETLEARVAEVHDEARTLEILNRTGIALAAELDLERLVQTVTDAGVAITEAQFGAFFYNLNGTSGDSYALYALSGVSREAFAGFPMPRNTAVFDPTFRGEGPVRSGDILADPRYGRTAPHYGMPKGHLPVRSYLAVPVISRSGEVLGGLFFGHAEPGVFSDRAERLITGIAAQAAVAIDNARLYHNSRQEIAARKRTEQALQALNDTLEQRVSERAQQLEASFGQLRESERGFRLLVEAVTDYAIYMLDPTGHVVKWNPGAERLKGYAEAEIIGQHFSRFYTEEDRRSGIPAQVIAGAALTGRYEGEGWRVRKDGSRFWASVAMHAIRDPLGQLLGFAKVTRDMTEQRAAEERLRQAQKMEAIGQLTGGVAHDFNNLLTVIGGNLETLQRRLVERDDQPLQRLVNAAMRAASRAAVLTHQLLAFSRRQPLEPKSVLVNSLITGMSDMLRRALPENISIETVLAGGVWPVFVDANQLENSLLNLAVNARDAMPDGGRLTIEAANVYLDEAYAATAELVPGQYVGIFVSDTGIGMTEDVAAKAFDPFFTTKDVGQGTGLGLSQVYGFVKQSGGHVRIYSEIGCGTTVKIYLPRLRSPDAAAEELPSAAPIPFGNGETVLVVEDQADVRLYSVEMLRELGYGVRDAPDGPTALRLIDAHRDITLLFTDVGLPGGMNGRQLADEALRRRPALKVLFTSGYARNAIVHHGRLDPGVHLITKPFTFSALAAKIRGVLDEP